MNQIDMIERGVIPTNKFGDLRIMCVILNYEYPRCFIAASSSNTYYALLENSDEYNCFGWNVSIVSLSEINEVNKGNRNIQSLFLNESLKYIIEFHNNDEVGMVVDVTEFSGKYSIKGNLFVNDFCDMEEVFDYHKLQIKSKKEKKLSISLLYENSNNSNTGLVFKTIKYINELSKNLKHPIDIMKSNFSVNAGSTVMTFEFDSTLENTLFGEFDSNEYNAPIAELGRIFNATEPEQIITETNGIKAVDKYSKMLDAFNHQRSQRPKIVFAIPQKEKAISFNFDNKSYDVKKKIVKAAKEFYESNKTISEENIIITGILTGILTGKESKFTFVAENQKIYVGTVDFNMLDNLTSFVVNGFIYRALLKKISIKTNNELLKESYVLLQLTPIEKVPNYKQIPLFDD